MGKSASCLRIIPCGGGGGASEPSEAGAADQTKSSKAKKGWSFKKRSSSGRAVTSSVIVETPSPVHKENVQSAAINFETANESIVTEKDSALQWDEKKPPPVATDLYVPEAVTVSETEKTPAAADSYVVDAVSVFETEKQPGVEDLSVTDHSTVSKTEEHELVIAVHESDVIIIQSAVRGFLARKEQIKHKSVVKLQAAVRGHLVRCHAIGALRCVQAIAKMQVLVRARYACRDSRKNDNTPKSKPEISYTSMTELLKSSFARQLLASSPKYKPINIKCDPLSRDSSWVWLERWMSLASPGAVDDFSAGIEKEQKVKNIENEPNEKIIEKEQEEKIIVEDYLFNEENEIFSDAKDSLISSNSADYSKSEFIEEANLVINGEITNFDDDSLSASSTTRQKSDTMDEVDKVESAAKIDSENYQDASENSLRDIVSVDEISDFKTEQALEIPTELGNEEAVQLMPDAEAAEVARLRTKDEHIVSGKEPDNMRDSEPEQVLVHISGNLSDSVPKIVVVEEPIVNSSVLEDDEDDLIHREAEVEDQASVSNSAVECMSVPQNAETEELVPHSSDIDLIAETAPSSEDDYTINHKEPSKPDHHPSIQDGGSECDTELSITSTLDSPDRLETGPIAVKSEMIEIADAESHVPESLSSIVNAEIRTESGSVEIENSDAVIGEATESATVADTGMVDNELETNASHIQSQPEAGEGEKLKMTMSDLPAEPEGSTERSHQASPGTQVTVSESQGTPSSQASVSTKPKRSKSEKSGSIKKRTILSAAKKSNGDSGGKNTVEELYKSAKSVKRRTSFGSPKPEASDQEQQRRDSSTSSSLPSYMQATESARAKANAGHSPRSSPDVADNNNEVFLRKRHSLSAAKDKQDSPRLRRTSSQAQSGSKSNGTSPLERKWQR
ncbi:unnamed protein product [Rhodiola kirilowii]